jgi:hypothetical protein
MGFTGVMVVEDIVVDRLALEVVGSDGLVKLVVWVVIAYVIV